jgi:multicomponent Na+:H+ antiporter subunit G
VTVLDVIVGVCAATGGVLVVLAGVGVVRFPDVYARMHAATKASTIGIALIGIAGGLALDEGRARILLTVAFIFITAPSAAHLVGRAAYRAEGVEIDLEARDDFAELMDAADRERGARTDPSG